MKSRQPSASQRRGACQANVRSTMGWVGAPKSCTVRSISSTAQGGPDCDQARAWRTRMISSRIRHTAPSVIALSAMLKLGIGLLGLTESLMMEVRKHNIRVCALTPSTVATSMAIDLKLTDGNPDKVLQAEDLAELVVAQLKLNRRALLKSASLWSTNP